jgi:hypothetical protein
MMPCPYDNITEHDTIDKKHKTPEEHNTIKLHTPDGEPIVYTIVTWFVFGLHIFVGSFGLSF